MGRIRIQISNDGLTATAQVDAGTPMTRDGLVELLQSSGVRHGLDDAALAELATRLSDEQCRGSFVVARGTPAVPGRDGHLELARAAGQRPGATAADGHMDYHERGALWAAAIGDAVAVWHPPVPGTPGCDVRDRRLPPPPPTDAPPRLGDGVRRDGERIVAARDGVVRHVVDREIDVLPLWQHDGDVDLQSGNLRARGTVVVRGDVHEGFEVHATGDVLIGGSVLSGQVRADGNVLIEQGVLGDSAIVAGADIACRIGTAARLEAGGCVRVRDHLAHCRVIADRIELLHGRGRVVGGELRARQSVWVLEAGTAAGARTLLIVADVSDQQQEVVRCDARTQQLRRAGRKLGADQDRGKGGKIGRQAVGAADRALAERLALARRQRELMRVATIEVRTRLHPGVQLRIGAEKLDIEQTTDGGSFRRDDEQGHIVRQGREP